MIDTRLYEAIAFDCDGVLLDSNRLKVSAFRRVAEEVGLNAADTEKFSAWQASNFGISRYRVFERLASGEFGKVDDTDVDRMVLRFAQLIETAYLEATESPSLRALLGQLHSKARLFVVSGSDESELRQLLDRRGLAVYFEEVLGSPTAKSVNLANLSERIRRGRRDARVLMIGDAEADFIAAGAAGTDFAAVTAWSMVPERMVALASEHGFKTAPSLNGLLAGSSA